MRGCHTIPGYRQRQTVLVVEVPEMQRLYQAILENHGYEVISADLGTGLDLLDRRSPGFDLLITNQPAPFVPFIPGIRILHVSGSLPETFDGRRTPGAVRMLAKPFSHGALIASVREMLGADYLP